MTTIETTHPMVLKAARAWCKRHAEATMISEADSWREFSEQFIEEAQAALDACGALACASLLYEARRARQLHWSRWRTWKEEVDQTLMRAGVKP